MKTIDIIITLSIIIPVALGIVAYFLDKQYPIKTYEVTYRRDCYTSRKPLEDGKFTIQAREFNAVQKAKDKLRFIKVETPPVVVRFWSCVEV